MSCFLPPSLSVCLSLPLNPIILHRGNVCRRGQLDADDAKVRPVSGD